MTRTGPSAIPGQRAEGPRVLLLVPARTYRAADFLVAAARMGLDLVIASDGALPLGGRPVIPVNPADVDASADRIAARAGTVSAVVAADTPMLMLAAVVAERMGLPHNPADGVRNAADKARQRQCWAAAGVSQPRFETVPAATDDMDDAGDADDAVRRASVAVGFPCVVKGVSLSASQGILRADDPASAVTAASRIRRILAAARRPGHEALLIEEYLPGPELSIDGMLDADGLTVTAVFDKPAMPDGPTFEETLLVTPSRLPGPVLATAIRTAGQAASALGLTHGPVHAELRVDQRGGQARPAMLELAARSIGGLCSRALGFSGGRTLEQLILASALGQPAPAASHVPARPSGVFMLPVPRPGTLRAVHGRADALAVPGITGLTITIPVGQQVLPLPDGDQYLGFVFAEADTREGVEEALTTASRTLRVVIEMNELCWGHVRPGAWSACLPTTVTRWPPRSAMAQPWSRRCSGTSRTCRSWTCGCRRPTRTRACAPRSPPARSCPAPPCWCLASTWRRPTLPTCSPTAPGRSATC
jgi:biotin carboxylase